jgi:hypothetical protein
MKSKSSSIIIPRGVVLLTTKAAPAAAAAPSPPATTTSSKTKSTDPSKDSKTTTPPSQKAVEQHAILRNQQQQKVHELRADLIKRGITVPKPTKPPTHNNPKQESKPSATTTKTTTTTTRQPFDENAFYQTTLKNYKRKQDRLSMTNKIVQRVEKQQQNMAEAQVTALARDILRNWNGSTNANFVSTINTPSFLKSPQAVNASFHPVLPKFHAPPATKEADDFRSILKMYGPRDVSGDPRINSLQKFVDKFFDERKRNRKRTITDSSDTSATGAVTTAGKMPQTSGAKLVDKLVLNKSATPCPPVWFVFSPNDEIWNHHVTTVPVIDSLFHGSGIEQQDIGWIYRPQPPNQYKFLIAFRSNEIREKALNHVKGNKSPTTTVTVTTNETINSSNNNT